MEETRISARWKSHKGCVLCIWFNDLVIILICGQSSRIVICPYRYENAPFPLTSPHLPPSLSRHVRVLISRKSRFAVYLQLDNIWSVSFILYIILLLYLLTICSAYIYLWCPLYWLIAYYRRSRTHVSQIICII